MNPDFEPLGLIRVEILKAYSALWKAPDCREAQAALGRCVQHLNYRGADCLPEVLAELELAAIALQGRKGGAAALQCVAEIALRVQAEIKKAASSQAA